MYSIIQQKSYGKYRINIMESTQIFDEEFFAEFIMSEVIATNLSSYDISDIDILESLIIECDSKSQAVGFELNDGSEFEALTNIFLKRNLNHMVLDDIVLFDVNRGIDVLSFDESVNMLNFSEVKSSVSKNERTRAKEREIMYTKLKEAFESQLCKNRKINRQVTGHIPTIKQTFSKETANNIISILKEVQRTRLTTSVVLNEYNDKIEFNNFIWCTSVLGIDIARIEDMLKTKRVPVKTKEGAEVECCFYCKKEKCASSNLFHEDNKSHNVNYNLYMTKISDRFSMQEYYLKLKKKLEDRVQELQ